MLGRTGRLWRLYHLTSPSIGPKILKARSFMNAPERPRFPSFRSMEPMNPEPLKPMSSVQEGFRSGHAGPADATQRGSGGW